MPIRNDNLEQADINEAERIDLAEDLAEAMPEDDGEEQPIEEVRPIAERVVIIARPFAERPIPQPRFAERPIPQPRRDDGFYIGQIGRGRDFYNKKVLSSGYVCAHCKKTLNPEISEKDTENNKLFETYRQSSKVNRGGKLKVVCLNCISYFDKCGSCNSYFDKEHLKQGYCEICINNAPQKSVLTYGFKVEDELGMRGKEPQDRIYYGIELELESENIGLDVLIVNSLVKDIARLKRDASIRHGFEIVSLPATMDEHYYMWDNFFEKLPPTCKPLHNCGMHVHATRDRMTDLQIAKILMFLHGKENRPFIKLIAGRDSNAQNDFTKEKKFGDCRAKVDRHTALNLNNERTIEFRIFWATRDRRVFLKNIEFCKALIKFADWATTSLGHSTHYVRFVEFVDAHRKEYPYLSLFLETPSMRELIGQ